jgi:hypothetical protein
MQIIPMAPLKARKTPTLYRVAYWARLGVSAIVINQHLRQLDYEREVAEHNSRFTIKP